MTPLKTRPYQDEALAALREGWATDLTRLAVVLPTGMGKTVVFAHLIAEAVAERRRPIVLVHRDELVNQTVDKVGAVAPGLSIGVVKAERREVSRDVLVGSVQTLARRNRREEIPPGSVGLVIVDECHHAAANSYLATMDWFGCFRAPGGTRAAGFTATLHRNDERGLGDVWESVAYKRDILFGIRGGYLSDVRGVAVELDGLDLARVARSRGDYQDGDLGRALMSAGAGEVIAASYREHAGDRQGVVFAPTVATAESFAEDLRSAGVPTEVITGATPLEDRHLVYKRYQAGDVQVLTTCMVLTEGWDAPWASCCVVARPTESPSLYTQMVGRVLRPWPDKADALVLDVVGASARHRLATIADLHESRVEPKPGETLRRAVEREEEERAERGRAAGERKAREVDLFHQSRSAWLQTPAGVWFVPTRERLFFVWPENEGSAGGAPSYRVGRTGTPYSMTGGGWLRDEPMPLEYAMAWAEQYAEQADPSVASRVAPWRAGRKPSDQQVNLAARLGVPVVGEDGEPVRKGELSDRISIHYASKLFDRRVGK